MINVENFWNLLEELSLITDDKRPYTRLSFSDYFFKARIYLEEKMKEYGLKTFIDPNGNLIGFKEGKNNKTFIVGSHSDTVNNGGRYDGVAGVCGGLELARAFKDKKLNHNLCVIDYLAEEPSEWGLSCIGSRALSGFLNKEHLELLNPNTKESLKNAIIRMGGTAQITPFSKLNLGKAVSSFELHIEQGKVLEDKKLNIGIVNAIVGILRLSIDFKGQSNHAGTTPFYLRDDAFLKACEFAIWANKEAKKLSDETYFVATIGKINVKPNATNVICGSCELIFDIRSDKDELLQKYKEILISKAKELNANFEEISFNNPTFCDANLMKILENNAKKLNLSYQFMPSGAGHDSAFLAKITPMCMIFVPSKNGISHDKSEFTSKEEFEKGLNLLYHTILERDKQ